MQFKTIYLTAVSAALLIGSSFAHAAKYDPTGPEYTDVVNCFKQPGHPICKAKRAQKRKAGKFGMKTRNVRAVVKVGRKVKVFRGSKAQVNRKMKRYLAKVLVKRDHNKAFRKINSLMASAGNGGTAAGRVGGSVSGTCHAGTSGAGCSISISINF